MSARTGRRRNGERTLQRAFGVNAAPSPPGSKASTGEPGAADEVKDAPSVPDSLHLQGDPNVWRCRVAWLITCAVSCHHE